MKFKQFIETYFTIDDPVNGQIVPFKFRPVQNKYYEILCNEYNESNNFKGLREVILKARKEGFTSLVLAIYAADILMNEHPVRYLEISYKDDATKQHYRRMKNYIMSYFRKKTGIKDDKQLEKNIFESQNEGSELVMLHNKASFYVGTASSKTGERGGTVQGILFSEAAHYPDTGIINAAETIESTRNQLSVGSGMIFMETTANGMNHFHTLWNNAKSNEVDYKPRFFSWRDFYTIEEFEQICKGFSNKNLIKQEYPEHDYDAFLTSGLPVFNMEILQSYLERIRQHQPLAEGMLVGSSDTPILERMENGFLKLYRPPELGRHYVIGADPGDGGADFTVAQVLDHKTLEQVATWRGKMGADEFGRALYLLGSYYNKALIAVERNGLGMGTIAILKNMYYPKLYMRNVEDGFTKQQTTDVGWVTNIKTRPELITILSQHIREKTLVLNDTQTVQELMTFVFNEKGKPEAVQGSHDDCVFSLGIGIMATQGTAEFATNEQDRLMYGENYERINDYAPDGGEAKSFRIGR